MNALPPGAHPTALRELESAQRPLLATVRLKGTKGPPEEKSPPEEMAQRLPGLYSAVGEEAIVPDAKGVRREGTVTTTLILTRRERKRGGDEPAGHSGRVLLLFCGLCHVASLARLLCISIRFSACEGPYHCQQGGHVLASLLAPLNSRTPLRQEASQDGTVMHAAGMLEPLLMADLGPGNTAPLPQKRTARVAGHQGPHASVSLEVGRVTNPGRHF